MPLVVMLELHLTLSTQTEYLDWFTESFAVDMMADGMSGQVFVYGDG